MIYRWFPLIMVVALAAGVIAAGAADIQPRHEKPIPLILPASLLLPNWILTDEPGWRYTLREPLPSMRIYREDEFNEIDAECVGCRPADMRWLIVVGALSAIIALMVRPIVRWAAERRYSTIVTGGE